MSDHLKLDPLTKFAVLSILDEAQDMTVATNRPDGYPQATVVSFVHEDGAIYFGCDGASQKANNLAKDDRVSITVTPPYDDWTQIRGLSIGGRARRVKDDAERMRVAALMLKRFPQIVDYVKAGESADIAIHRVEPEVISLLDYREGFAHAELHRLD